VPLFARTLDSIGWRILHGATARILYHPLILYPKIAAPSMNFCRCKVSILNVCLLEANPSEAWLCVDPSQTSEVPRDGLQGSVRVLRAQYVCPFWLDPFQTLRQTHAQ
jgi:hypothetical protein